ncbi:hypothetical protein INR49_007538 [Caranx melampygus]|nr:hypothetical protein INR49_007538 [Caranx melampygus]
MFIPSVAAETVLLPAAQPQDLQDLQDLQDPQDQWGPHDLQNHQDPWDPQDLQDQCAGGSCSPQLGDLIVGRAAQLSASSTCGLHGPQNYCIIGYLEEGQKCFTCDSRLPYDRYSNPDSHLIENVITTFDPERKMKWWQSENAAMLVERSKDFGQTWKVFRYYAEDCALHFPSVSNEPADSIDDVVLKALDPIFGIQNPYAPNIQDLITVTNIRVNFSRLFTLGDTLLGRRRRNPQDKYYYALYNMVVRGSCFCNGHARHCTPVHGHCVCQHNTAGHNCERCQDFHHDSPWRPGGDTADVCRRCNCHGHSDSCHFDAARFDATGGVSGGVCDDCRHDRTGPQCEQCRPFLYQDPQRAADDPHACIPCDCDSAGSHGGGVCDALSGQCQCKENVEGQRCDRCKHGFFNLRRDDPAGVMPWEVSDHVISKLEVANVTIWRAGHCVIIAGFWGLGNSAFRCSPCDCDVGGAHSSTCSPEDGQCQCLPNMIGRRCSDPAPGYFLPHLDYFLYEAELASPLHKDSSPLTEMPSSSSLLSPVVLPQCEKYYRERGFDFDFSNGRIILVRRTRRFARRRRQGQQQSSIPLYPGHALQIIPRQRTSDQPITWSGLGLVRVLEGVGLRFTVDNLPSSMDYQLLIRYEPETPSDWLASVSIIMLSPGDGGCSHNPTGSYTLILPGNSRSSVLDAVVCLNAGGRYFVDIVFNKKPGSDGSDGSDGSYILVDSMGLIPRIESVQNFCSQSDLESFRHFRCVGLAAEVNSPESLPEHCEELIKSLSAKIYNGAVVCRCNVNGALGPSCSKLGGVCECKPNVIGRCCDTCAPLTFGFGPEGCKPCECDHLGSMSKMCDQVRGQCACRSEVTGRRCDRCQTGFWDFPHCRPCECNGLSEACDEKTGECVNCREHSAGPHCERCVEGYYGNPVSRQSCQPCLCPDIQGSGRFFAISCHHDPQSFGFTCSCKRGHTGPRCDRCSPGFYGDLTELGASCEECPCNNNIDLEDRDACDSRTGECRRCLHNAMGPHCQSCKPGYYGNALVQDCKACDCNLEGTERPSCDPETGECICRTGVTGIFCDECAPGYSSEFPACEECHPCTALWAQNVIDVQRATQRMRTFIPRHGDDMRPGDSRHQQQMLEVHLKLDNLTNLTGLSPPMLEKVEKLWTKIKKLKDAIDPNMILIDPSPLLNTEIDNIHLDFKKLLNRLKDKVTEGPDDEDDDEDLEELQDEIQKLHRDFMLDEKKVKNASEGLEDSMDTRQGIKHKLSTCNRGGGDLAPLEKKINELSVVQLNQKDVVEHCAFWIWETGSVGAHPVMESFLPINSAKQAAQETKDQAKDLQDRINGNMEAFEKEKTKTRELIKQVKDYLIDEMVPPEDIEKIARAVLNIHLPQSPEQIQSMISEINNLLSNATHFQDDLKNTEQHAKISQDLLLEAEKLKQRMKDIDVTEINRDIYEAERFQDEANNDLETASRDGDMSKEQIRQIKEKLDDIETKLQSPRAENLKNDIKGLKNNSESNRAMAREAHEAAQSALNATDTRKELDDVMKLFEILKQEKSSQTAQGETEERLRSIMEEAEDIKRRVEDKLWQIQDVQQRIQQLIKRNEEKSAEVSGLLETVDSLRKEISRRAEDQDQDQDQYQDKRMVALQLALLLVLQVCTCAQEGGASVGYDLDVNLPELSDVCTEGSCYPATGDLLIGRAHQLSSTSTCAAPYNELANQTSSHRIENVVTTFAPNRLKTWWQSENGLENVTVQLNLEAEFHFTHLIMTFKTFRPAAMVIERSADFGKTWQVYRYFAYDCETSFPDISQGPMQKVDDVICDSRYSDIEPSTEGEVIFRVLDPAFRINDPYSPRIQNMLKITNLRVKFTKLHTLGDNLLDSRMEIKEKYYYAIYDMVVRGNCFCYGHASECAPIQGAGPAQEGMVHGHCMCNHNTKGLNCEKCQDFYHDLPWRPAEGRNTNACKKCNCNKHSDSCHFDMAVYVASGNVSGGVCDSCQHNTAGHNCEQCQPFYYQHPERDVRDPNICQPCNCDPLGSLNGGICDGLTDVRTGLISGQCRCKVHSEHWGLSNDMDGCRPCDCDLGGAVNNQCDQVSGQCVCRDHMFGRRCDQVESGFYFVALDHYTYEAEDATFGPGVTIVPRPRPQDHSPTWTGMGLVNMPEGAFLEFSVDNIPHSMEYDIIIRYEPQLPDQWEEVLMTVMRPRPIKADSRCVNTVPDDDHQMTSLHPGSRYVVLQRPVCFESSLNYTVRLSLPLYSAASDVQSPYTLIDSIVLMPHCKDLEIFTGSEGGDSGGNSGWETFQRYRCLENSQGVIKTPMTDICQHFIFSISAMLHQGAKECQCDPQGSLSTVCDPSGGQCQCRPNVVGRNCDSCAPATFHFGPSGCRECECDPLGSRGPFCDQLSGQCVCVTGAYGRRCDRCLQGHWGFPTCRPCSCNGHTDDCDATTGFCIDCRDHSTGHTCDRCLDGYYGNPVLGSGDHCRPCMCPDGPGSQRQFAGSCYRSIDSQQAICVCNTGYRGARCDECSPGYHGNPGEPGGQCQPCQCNGNINMLDPESCDAQTGKCLRCLYHSEGATCQTCKLGYYGNALLQDCRKCVCNQLGSDPSSCPSPGDCHCDRSSGHCHCLPNVVGQHCDRCTPNTWNMASGSGCQTCDCDTKHSYGPSCDEVSGQCSCHPGFGGRTCSECRELFWGDPECVCVVGVAGRRCDVCARGFSGTFPDCQQCHQCFAEWDDVIGQLTNQTHRLVNKVNTIKAGGVSGPYKKAMDSVERSAAEIRVLLNQNPASQPLSEIQHLLDQTNDLMTALSQVLNYTEQTLVPVQDQDSGAQTKLDSVTSDAQKLERTVQELLDQVEFMKNSDIRGATNSITKYLLQSQEAEARANASTMDTGSPVETSATLRQLTVDKLNRSREDFLRKHSKHAQRLDDLAGELQTLDLSEISHKTCGSPSPGQDLCSSSCGGLGCVDSEGRTMCGGEGCDGVVTTASSVWNKAQESEQEILSTVGEVEKLSRMVLAAKLQADEARLSARDILMKTNTTKQRMPTTPAQLQNLTEEIRQKVGELGHVEAMLQQSANDIQRAENLLDQARQVSNEAADVKDSAEKVKRALEEAERAHTAASGAIQQATADIQSTNDLLSSVQSETADAEMKLNNTTQRLQRLEQNVTLLKDKALNISLSTEQTNQDAASIREIAEEVKKDLESNLREKYSTVGQLIGQKAGGVADAKKRAESLQQEAKELLLQASNKLQLLKDLEKSYKDNQQTLEVKAELLVELEAAVKELLQEISHKVTVYSTCLF